MCIATGLCILTLIAPMEICCVDIALIDLSCSQEVYRDLLGTVAKLSMQPSNRDPDALRDCPPFGTTFGLL